MTRFIGLFLAGQCGAVRGTGGTPLTKNTSSQPLHRFGPRDRPGAVFSWVFGACLDTEIAIYCGRMRECMGTCQNAKYEVDLAALGLRNDDFEGIS